MTVLYWHAVLMVLAWLVLMPLGTLVARFYKVRPGRGFPQRLDDPFWWNAHRGLQSAGAAVALFAAWLVYDALGGEVDWAVTHVRFGLAALGLCAGQIASACIRGTKGGPTGEFADPADPLTWRGDHYDMTLHRRMFEAWHKVCGYLSIALACCAIWTGIDLALLPAWLVLPLGFVVACHGVVFARLSRKRRRVDTWQAIWGPDGR